MFQTDNMKKILALIIISVFLTGCQTEEPQSAPLPTKDNTISAEASKAIVVLSYPSADFAKLNRVTFEVPGLGNSPAYLAATSLLSGRSSQDYYVPFGGSASLQNIAVSRNLVKIDILGDFSSVSDQEFFCSIISLTNTLTELEDIEYVKLRINGEDYKPLGIFSNPLTHEDENLYLLYLQHQDYLRNGTAANKDFKSKSLLYFSDLSGKFLLAEVRSSYQSGENLAVDLINQLKSGPAASDEMKGTIPKNVVIQNQPQVHEDPINGLVLTVSLEAPKHEAIDNDARYMMAASIVSTMQSNIPEIDAVRVLINSQPAISASIMKESDFNDMLGNIVTLYFPNEGSTYLIPVNRAMSQFDYKLASSRLKGLIRGLLPNETSSATNIFPSNITEDDLLSVTVSGTTAYVDFSSSLKTSCDYISSKESMLIYSIVNTLTEFNNIKRVQLLIDGEIIETLCGNLSIQEPLLPNPGIIQR